MEHEFDAFAAVYVHSDSVLLAPQIQVDQIEHLHEERYAGHHTYLASFLVLAFANQKNGSCLPAHSTILLVVETVQEKLAQLAMALDRLLASSVRTACWLASLL